jgi:hypothetical protein
VRAARIRNTTINRLRRDDVCAAGVDVIPFPLRQVSRRASPAPRTRSPRSRMPRRSSPGAPTSLRTCCRAAGVSDTSGNALPWESGDSSSRPWAPRSQNRTSLAPVWRRFGGSNPFKTVHVSETSRMSLPPYLLGCTPRHLSGDKWPSSIAMPAARRCFRSSPAAINARSVAPCSTARTSRACHCDGSPAVWPHHPNVQLYHLQVRCLPSRSSRGVKIEVRTVVSAKD